MQLCKLHNHVLQRAVAALNSLQTNASVRVLKQKKQKREKQRSDNMIKMYQYLERTGLKV